VAEVAEVAKVAPPQKVYSYGARSQSTPEDKDESLAPVVKSVEIVSPRSMATELQEADQLGNDDEVNGNR
jgi:hypothetical protein